MSPRIPPMSWRAAGCLLVAVVLVAGCESNSSEAEKEGENAPAAQTVRAFYAAANRAAGDEACTLLTTRGIQQVVHVSSRAGCISTIGGLARGSFSSEEGELLHIEGVD